MLTQTNILQLYATIRGEVMAGNLFRCLSAVVCIKGVEKTEYDIYEGKGDQ